MLRGVLIVVAKQETWMVLWAHKEGTRCSRLAPTQHGPENGGEKNGVGNGGVQAVTHS